MNTQSEEMSIYSEIASRNTQGEIFIPTFLTKGGITIQGGAFAATIANIEAYNQGNRGVVEEDLKAVIPLLVKAGLFNLFTPKEWKSDTNEGRSFVGRLAEEYLKSL